jgi:hypothetical protein
MNSYRSLALLLCAIALSACEKNAVQDITGPLPSARIMFYNFGVNAPAVNFYANETKMTAILSATGSESAVGVGYGGVAAGGYYAGIAPGQYTLSGRIAAVTDKDRPISNVTATIEDGKHYSFYQSGFYNTTTKTADGFIVEDAFPATIDFSAAYVRFVNAISNSTPMTMYARLTTTGAQNPIGGSVAYKSAGEFIRVPVGVYDLSTRTAGSTTDAIVRTAVPFLAGRVYTIAAIGDMTLTSTATTVANRRRLDLASNR